ncbi:hypothetical protein NHX12_002139, partial [Muraenolepis orangiensis]
MLSDSSTMVGLSDDVLQNWKLIGRGGFGAVYRATQKDWHFDVAVKMLHTNTHPDSEELWREAKNMTKASSQFVTRVFGVYRGCPPGGRTTGEQAGLVMELMKRGTLEALLQGLAGPPPWPLAFRLAHQLALGMNFLHTMAPPLLHKDLKPSNVLLDDDLNAKLADFGLSRVCILKNSRKTTGGGGTVAYTPPEAFQLSYRPRLSYDVYSYGIVLWSILTDAFMSSLVALRVPHGDRPPAHEVDTSQAEGLSDLSELMEKCWDGDSARRPSSGDCSEVTSCVFSRHGMAIRNAVDQVLSKLDSESQTLPIPQSACISVRSYAVPQAQFVDYHRADIIQEVSTAMAITEHLGNMVHPETYSQIQAKDTNQDKIRVLYTTTLHAGGVEVKAAFYDGLEILESSLLE